MLLSANLSGLDLQAKLSGNMTDEELLRGSGNFLSFYVERK